MPAKKKVALAGNSLRERAARKCLCGITPNRLCTTTSPASNGHRPAQLYDMVLREVEEPLFKAVLEYVEGNQSRAAGILGINRGTLRKKLRQFGLSA